MQSSAVPFTSCRVSPTSVLCQECIPHSLATLLPLLLDTHRPAGTLSWDVSEEEKNDDVSGIEPKKERGLKKMNVEEKIQKGV